MRWVGIGGTGVAFLGGNHLSLTGATGSILRPLEHRSRRSSRTLRSSSTVLEVSDVCGAVVGAPDGADPSEPAGRYGWRRVRRPGAATGPDTGEGDTELETSLLLPSSLVDLFHIPSRFFECTSHLCACH